MPATAFLGLGSNLGDRIGYLRAAVRAFGANKHIEVVRWSGVYETEPVEVGVGHPDYLNCVLQVTCSLPPMELLCFCQGVEAALGRDRKGEMAPRTIDIDVLLYGDEVIDAPDLVVPHRGVTRSFNLKCLADLDRRRFIPGIGVIEELIAETDMSGVRKSREKLSPYGGSLR